MAATWRGTSAAIAWASAKSMIDIFQAVGSTKVLRCTRFYLFNNGTGAVTGVLITVQVRRIITAVSGGSTVTPVKHDTTSAALNANTSMGTGRTVTGSDVFRRIVMSNDEPAVSGSTMDEWELLVPNALIFEAGYGDSNVESIVCNAATTEGADITQTSASAVGTCDAEIEFTNT